MTYYTAPAILSQRVTIDKIREAVCQYFQLEEDKLKSGLRQSEYAYGRHLIRYIAYNKIKMDKSEIARKLNIEHTTVINSVKRIEDKISINPEFDKDIHWVFFLSKQI